MAPPLTGSLPTLTPARKVNPSDAIITLIGSTIAHACTEVLDDGEVDVCFKQCEPYLAKSVVDIGFGEFSLALESTKNGLEPIGK